MRLTIQLAGFTLDWSLEPSAAEAEDDPAAALNGGYTTSTPVGFVAQHDVPAEIPYVERNPGWGDEGN